MNVVNARNKGKSDEKTTRFFGRSLTDFHWFGLFFLAAIALWTISLGNVPLRDWDEASHAMVARELYRSGNWLYLTFFGQPYFMKPPLGYWIVASSYHLFGGVSELTTRLPVALLTAMGVPLLYLLGREIFPRRLSAIVSASVYLTLLPVVRHGRLMMLDGLVNTFFILLLLAVVRARKRRVWAVAIGLCLAAIALTKGILVFPLWAIAGAFILYDRDGKIFKNPYAWLGLFLGASLAGGWYYAQWLKYGDVFVRIHLGTQNFDRLATAVEGNDGPPWYYLLELLKYTFPWLLFWPGGLILAWQNRGFKAKNKHSPNSWANLILLGTIIFLTTISLMGTKLPWYVMPLYPFFALAVGAKLTLMEETGKGYSRFFTAFFGLLSLLGLASCGYFWLADRQPALILMGIVIALTMGLTARRMQQKDRAFIPLLAIGLYFSFALLMVSTSWNWELNEQFPVVRIGRLIRANTPPDRVIYTSFAYNRPSLDFYSDRAVNPADLPALRQHWQAGDCLLLDAIAFSALSPPTGDILGTVDGFTLIRRN